MTRGKLPNQLRAAATNYPQYLAGKQLLSGGQREALRVMSNLMNQAADALEPDDQNIGQTINNPAHYTSNESGIECIEITRHLMGPLSNVIKYLWRTDLKNGTEDILKARKYISWINTPDDLHISPQLKLETVEYAKRFSTNEPLYLALVAVSDIIYGDIEEAIEALTFLADQIDKYTTRQDG